MKLPRLVLILLVLAAQFIAPVKQVSAGEEPGGQVDQQVIEPVLQQSLDRLPAGEMVDVIVEMHPPAGARLNLKALAGQEEDRNRRLERVVTGLQQESSSAQMSARLLLSVRKREGSVAAFTPFWIFNGLSVRATPGVIQELAALPEVRQIRADAAVVLPADEPPDQQSSTINLDMIGAPDLWTMGLRGQGVVVANLDTGVAAGHPALSAQWRGGSNSWFNPYDPDYRSAVPQDIAGYFTGHGTATMGIMLGQESGMVGPGVAPEARWIAAKIFNDNGEATKTAVHLSFQWLLDPDGNPLTADAPQVVSNSWTFTVGRCDDEFQPDLQALRAVGILPIFSAGNYYNPNPGVLSDASPANYPEAFAVGAIDNLNEIASFSSRGPSSCDGSIYPEISAPGVGELTTFYNGGYIYQSGTSISAPHAAGGLALLLNAYPDLTVSEQEQALKLAALDLGEPTPDNTYGYGRMDLYSAYYWIRANRSIVYWLFLPLTAY